MVDERQSRDIAVIGSGCRFPGGANSPSKLWELLREPRVVASGVPFLKGFYHPNNNYHGHANVKEAYLLREGEDGNGEGDEDAEGAKRRFDASFFGISPVEASTLDPQIRLLLETVYEALEAGGQTLDALKGSDTAMYAGEMTGDYEFVMHQDHDNLGKYHATGSSRAMLSNRISHFFDWQGPSMTMDTACSSSLVALHQAVQQLRTGESRTAVVAGANLMYDVGLFVAESSLQMLSPDGRSKMWDVDANGYARGEGVAAMILKTKAAAEADGDHIECIIRGTAIGQDGKTPGITMPSASAQTQLIRDCYQRAGLDLTNPADRPHYIEAHGTGTQAGDPVEAEALATAFYPDGRSDSQNSEPLFVGSIKTVVGHTEGTAGVAGLLKASLALQNVQVPPNLNFNTLNPKIEPFYNGLCIPTSLQPWPAVSDNSPRRVSVNSFGFGGANAHAILESYTPPPHLQSPCQNQTNCLDAVFSPFVFSANSETALKSYLYRVCDYLKKLGDDTPNLRDLAYTLDARRTRLQYATSFSAFTVSELQNKIEEALETSNGDSRIGIRPSQQDDEKPCILGVFTGQGAQWAQMGRGLVESSDACRSVIARLQSRLDQLPPEHCPTWTLLEELEKDSSSCRVSEPAISQPLCTAVQILQVDILRAAGLEFTAVVGHSSGEIACAYAADLISAEDAICIAYYRGFEPADKSDEPAQKPGAMMAVGTSQSDAEDLLAFPEFEGRANVAAVNSATSVTLSGDQDAIEELKIVFEDEQKFARVLRVERAYHSHHMKRFAGRYLKQLSALNIRLQSGEANATRWFSSVNGTEAMSAANLSLKDQYWIDNMVNPVLFMQSVQTATQNIGSPDLVFEVGPHPALKGPCIQTIQEQTERQAAHTSLLHRGIPAVKSVAQGLGHAWAHLGKSVVNLQGYDRFASGGAACRLLKGLPSYAWDHQAEHWHESRYARTARLRQPVHELLGHQTADSTEHDKRWRHILRASEIPWLKDHQLQNSTIFPAAGYIMSAVEAAIRLHEDSPVAMVEILDVDIASALVFRQSDSSIEVVLSLHNIQKQEKLDNVVEADFKYHASSESPSDPLELKVSGRVRAHFGAEDETVLPPRASRPENLNTVNRDWFYDSISELGYQYAGQFATLDGLQRKLGVATGEIPVTEPSSLLVHPGILDAAFQSVFLTYSAPYDEAQTSIYVPRRIERLAINPSLCKPAGTNVEKYMFDTAHAKELPHVNMYGDIDIYPDNSTHAGIQVQGLECVPLTPPTSKEDREVFSHLLWDVAQPDLSYLGRDHEIKSTDAGLTTLLDRISNFYLRSMANTASKELLSNLPEALVEFASNINSAATPGAWVNDTLETLTEASKEYADTIDVKLLKEIGTSLLHSAEGHKVVSSPSLDARLMSEWYMQGLAASTATAAVAGAVKQMTHRYPDMHILELRGDSATDTASDMILHKIRQKMASYTIIAPTSNTSDDHRAWLKQNEDSVSFKVSEDLKSLRDQGVVDGSYDMVVVPLGLRAAPTLEQTLSTSRRLLKPGGHLVVLDLQSTFSPFATMVFGSMQSWWRAGSKDKTPSLAFSKEEWNGLLQSNGYSGVDTRISDSENPTPFTVFTTQAVDGNISFIRNPLSATLPSGIQKPLLPDLLTVGGQRSKTNGLVSKLQETLKPFSGRIRSVASLPEVTNMDLTPETVILGFADVDADANVFSSLDETNWGALQRMLGHSGTLMWVSHGRRAKNPHSNIMLGLMRGAARENPAFSSLLLDIENEQMIQHGIVAETLLQYMVSRQWQHGDRSVCSTVEPELVLDTEGRMLIPRLVMSDELNDRFNTDRRDIRRPSLDTGNVCVKAKEDGEWDIENQPELALENGNGIEKSLRLRTTYSSLSALRIAELGYMFLMIGDGPSDGAKKVALASKNSAYVSAPEQLSVDISENETSSFSALLSLISQHLISSSILLDLEKDDKLLIHEPSSHLASIMVAEAWSRGIEVTFTTTGPVESKAQNQNWVTVHPSASERALSWLSRGRFSAFVDLSVSGSQAELVVDRMVKALPTHCHKESSTSLFSQEGWIPRSSHWQEMRSRLVEAVDKASASVVDGSMSQAEPDTVSLQSLTTATTPLSAFTIIDWEGKSTVQAKVCAVDSYVAFSPAKTYWLAGLTGGLGLSLCEWMSTRGARHFVLSSRTPKVNDSWLDDMQAKGVNIKVASCDVTCEEKVTALYEEITSTMPPVAGVAQGVMVLEDTPIDNMSLDQLLKVSKPKVEGSIHLNNLFQQDTLDFFIFFSSASSVVGNHGQANYAAGNLFMSSLAEQRRQRGLAASVIDIGPVFGVGYVTRFIDRSTMGRVTMKSGGFAATSERGFHQLFGEAVLSSRPSSGYPTELVSGIRKCNPADEHQPQWHSWPRFSHFVMKSDNNDNAGGDGNGAKVSVKSQLAKAQSEDAVLEIIWEAFGRELESLFKLDVSQSSRTDLAEMRFDQMGVDSLIAVEIRSWFMKTLEVDIPVLKILNGGSVGDLVKMAGENIPGKLIPCVSGYAPDDASLPTTDSSNSNKAGDASPSSTYNLSSPSSDDISMSGSSDALVKTPFTPTSDGRKVIKSVPVSYTQSRFYPAGIFLQDPSGLNHTAHVRVTQRLDRARLAEAVRTLGREHEILRTAFWEENGHRKQHILDSSFLHLECYEVNDEEEVNNIAHSLQKEYIYDLAGGETLRIMLLTRESKEDYLVFGIHPIALDATSIQGFIRWLGFYYLNPGVYPPAKQFAEASEERRIDYEAGRFKPESEYWRKVFSTQPPPMPLLTLSKVKERPAIEAYQNIRASCNVSPETKAQVQEVCRKLRVTPFHFYLAALRALIIRYTIGGEDTTIGLTEFGRKDDVNEWDCLGPLYNVVFVRILANESTRFQDLLEETRDKTYQGLANSALPYSMLDKELGLNAAAKSYPFFQVLYVYRMGQRLKIPWSEKDGLNLDVMGLDLNVPYDVYLDTIDQPDGECYHLLLFRKDILDQSAADELAHSYHRLIQAFATKAEMAIAEADLSEVEE